MPVALLALLACLACLPGAGMAAEDMPARYQVDILLFTRPLTPARWPASTPMPDSYRQARRLQPWQEESQAWQPPLHANPVGTHDFEALPEDRQQLLRARARMERSSRFRVIRHLSWQQTAPERGQQQAVRLLPPEPGSRHDRPGDSPLIRLTEDAQPTDTEITPVQGALDGIASLYQGNYLHLKLDLFHCQAQAANGLLQTEPYCWRFVQDYRIRPDRLYYFDHPHFGALARVRKLEPEPADSAQGVAH